MTTKTTDLMMIWFGFNKAIDKTKLAFDVANKNE